MKAIHNDSLAAIYQETNVVNNAKIQNESNSQQRSEIWSIGIECCQ